MTCEVSRKKHKHLFSHYCVHVKLQIGIGFWWSVRTSIWVTSELLGKFHIGHKCRHRCPENLSFFPVLRICSTPQLVSAFLENSVFFLQEFSIVIWACSLRKPRLHTHPTIHSNNIKSRPCLVTWYDLGIICSPLIQFLANHMLCFLHVITRIQVTWNTFPKYLDDNLESD